MGLQVFNLKVFMNTHVQYILHIILGLQKKNMIISPQAFRVDLLNVIIIKYTEIWGYILIKCGRVPLIWIVSKNVCFTTRFWASIAFLNTYGFLCSAWCKDRHLSSLKGLSKAKPHEGNVCFIQIIVFFIFSNHKTPSITMPHNPFRHI